MKKTVLLATLALSSFAHAYEAQITKGQAPATLAAMIEKANSETGATYTDQDFMLVENRQLATSNFTMYVQANSGVPVAATGIRIWADKTTGELILAEIHLNDAAKAQAGAHAAKFQKGRFSSAALRSQMMATVVSRLIAAELVKHSDSKVLGLKSRDQWVNGDLVRQVEVRGRRGVHQISVSLSRGQVVKSAYSEFPQADLEAHVYPIYEVVEDTGQVLPHEVRTLKNINAQVHEAGEDPFGSLSSTQFPYAKQNTLRSMTAQGRAEGYWSEGSLRAMVDQAVGNLPLRDNSFANGLLLQGKYATINLHPAVADIQGVGFDLKLNTGHIIGYGQDASGNYFAGPIPGFLGKPINSQEDLSNRLPERPADNAVLSYINNGFDEVQVYYGVSFLMEALNDMGLKDPEFSTKPFEAFLYDTDITMRDNAYYYDNTINFTTYSPGAPNFARDNPTVWHELGHGIMDRLMGPLLGFADSNGGGYGGLSEGMADFVGVVITNYETNGADFPGRDNFRIVNKTGLYLTNEFHDDGEAYGGTMRDALMMAMAREGRDGLKRFTDLVLESMRLTRNHPSLTPRGWFEHLLYADSLGSSVRSPGQYREFIMSALASRNFGWNASFKPASLTIKFGDANTELTNSSPASRNNPIMVARDSGDVSYNLAVSLNPGDSDFIKFPATVKVEYHKGALQGAIKWEGEEANPTVYTVGSQDEILNIPLKASTTCESINQPGNQCKDYAYVQVFNPGGVKPVAKKRFYLQTR